MFTLRIHRVWGSVQSELGRLGRHRAIAHPRTDLPLSQVAFHVCRMGFIHPQTSWSSINFHEIPCSKLRISHRFVWVFVPHPKKKRPSLKTKHLTLLPCHRCHSTQKAWHKAHLEQAWWNEWNIGLRGDSIGLMVNHDVQCGRSDLWSPSRAQAIENRKGTAVNQGGLDHLRSKFIQNSSKIWASKQQEDQGYFNDSRTMKKKTRVGPMSGNGQTMLHLQLATVSIIELTCGRVAMVNGGRLLPTSSHISTEHAPCFWKSLQVMHVAPQNLRGLHHSKRHKHATPRLIQNFALCSGAFQRHAETISWHHEIRWLVGGWPTPLKNHGVKVSWDDEIPMMGKS